MLLLPLPLPGLELQACTTIPRLIKGSKQCQIYKKCSRLEVQLNPREACKHVQGCVFNLSAIHVNQSSNKGRKGKGEEGGRTPTKAMVRKVGGERKRKREGEGREREEANQNIPGKRNEKGPVTRKASYLVKVIICLLIFLHQSLQLA